MTAHRFPASSDQWTIVDHVCRHCLGRMLRDEGVWRCSGCGQTSIGGPEGVCCCGIKIAAPAKGGAPGQPVTRRVRFFCARNPARSFQSPAEVVAMFSDGEGDHIAEPVAPK